jgi:hypothetical protein
MVVLADDPLANITPGTRRATNVKMDVEEEVRWETLETLVALGSRTDGWFSTEEPWRLRA